MTWSDGIPLKFAAPCCREFVVFPGLRVETGGTRGWVCVRCFPTHAAPPTNSVRRDPGLRKDGAPAPSNGSRRQFSKW